MKKKNDRQLNSGRDFRMIAMYLPQFHRTPENDRFWGEGFTDWVSTREAEPLFEGHRQPRIPLGKRYYDLTDADTLKNQAALAAGYGIDGFCFYHYWFGDGNKVLYRPAELLLEQKEIAMPFCFCWANDSWARSWTGREDSNPWADRYEADPEAAAGADGSAAEDGILIRQEYGNEEFWKRHFRYLLPFFRDERYITKDGRPVFLIYKADLIPCADDMFACWQRLAREEGFPGLFLIGANLKEENGAYQASLIHAPSQILPYQEARRKSRVRCFSYTDVWKRILQAGPAGRTTTLYGGFIDYDDTPRRGHAGMLVEGASPERFREYMTALIRKNRLAGNDLVFLNAWNEWGEGNYLEPDTAQGYAWLETVRRVLEEREYLTEKEYVLSVFDRAFSAFRDKTIVLYGAGENAKAILKTFADRYHFAGVTDDYAEACRRQKGITDRAYLEGVPVLSMKEVLDKKPDLVILAARLLSIEPLYRRIGAVCRRNGIALYDMYGRDETELHETARAARCLCRADRQKLTEPYDVISIDLKDTLFRQDPEIPSALYADRELADLAKRAAAAGKTVLFAAEEALPLETYQDALRKAGLFETGTILSEEETGRGKFNGFFRIMAARYSGKKILHIGNEFAADVLIPELYGISGFGYGFVIVEDDWPETVPSGDSLSGTIPAGKRHAGRENRESLLREIREHDVVTFDIFDTLVRRRTRTEEERFYLIRERAEAEGIRCPELFAARKRAQARSENPTLTEIYAELQRCTGLTDRERDRLLKLEIETEKQDLYPVPGMREILESAVRRCRAVYLVSDMYLPEEVLQSLMDGCGIRGYKKIFVSCRYRKRKQAGLFEIVREYAREHMPEGERPVILHVGDSLTCDILPARRAGFDTFLTGPEDPAEETASWWTEQTAKAEHCAEHVLAPLMAGYVRWLAEQAEGTDGVLFAARDGWIPYLLWKSMEEQYPESLFPRGHYLYTSRMAAYRAAEGENENDPEGMRCRRGFLRYLDREGLKGGRYVFSDFVSAGTTQRYLQKICPFVLRGAYAGTPEEVFPDVPFCAFAERRPEGSLYAFRILEYLLAAPHPHTVGYTASGEPVFAEEYRTEEELRLLARARDATLYRAGELLRNGYGKGDQPDTQKILYGPRDIPDLYRFIVDDGRTALRPDLPIRK